MEEAFFFGNEGSRLFAVLHRPESIKERKGIIFCHPFGEEKQYSYRVFVRFARELCDMNFYVLRFDCLGYGDSQGNFEDATLETYVDDTVKAVDLLKGRLGIEKIALLGLRLGGTVAAMAAERSRTERLILWFPVVNGREYLGELIKTRILAELINKMPSRSQNGIIEEIETTGGADIGGYYLTREMYRQIAEVGQTTYGTHFKGSVYIAAMKSATKQVKSLEEFAEGYARNEGNSCALKIIEEKVFWNMQSLYDWYFPENLYRDTLKWILGN
ncbi:MAG: alpha/beta hydrolase [Candidatus Brocadia sp.]|jgi:exosortase A-associated hydrolase 2